MRLPILILTVFILINLAVDTYIYIALKRRFKSKWPSRIHVFLSLALFAMICTETLPTPFAGHNVDALHLYRILSAEISLYFN